MQQTEHEDQQPVVAPADLHSHLLQPVALVQDDESDDPDVIFVRAVAEIDTQPLPKQAAAFTITDVLEIVFLVSVLCVGLGGMIWQAITYPHTLVILYAKEYPASITATLALPTRTLAPVTVTRSHTSPTTGYGYQDARAASGILTFYNGNFSPQSLPVGTVFTGADGVKIATQEAVTVPAAQPPQFATARVAATAVHTGSTTNIAAGDIHHALSSAFLVKNLSAFTGGRDARDFQAVALTDIDTVTATLHTTLMQQMPQAFSLRAGESVIPTACTFTASANHAVGEEAATVTVTAQETCRGIAYNRQQLTRQATAALTRTKPAAHYHLIGSAQTTLQSVSPLLVTISGKWVYTFSQDYEQLLAQKIAGESPARAQASLLKTGVIAYASIPNTLPPAAMYINFLVLVG